MPEEAAGGRVAAVESGGRRVGRGGRKVGRTLKALAS